MTMNSAIAWIERHWRLEDGSKITLKPWRRIVLEAIFSESGVPEFETFLISTVKKAGKTELSAAATLYAPLTMPASITTLAVANDIEQARERVFDRIVRIVRTMGGDRVRVTANEVRFRETGSRIQTVPADFAGAAGAIFSLTSWTELWAYRHEQHVGSWEELRPIPNRRSIRIVASCRLAAMPSKSASTFTASRGLPDESMGPCSSR
jgi:phage terminase large subunit-like protein